MYKFINANREHLHTFDEKPLIGVSSVIKVISKPLTWWASGKAVEELGWLDPKKFSQDEREETARNALEYLIELTPEEYLKELDKAYGAHWKSLKDSAEGGTDLHSILEGFVKAQMEKKDWVEDKRIKNFVSWSLVNVKRFLWSEMHCYSEELWIGGISDCGFEDMEGKVGIMDFKLSKEAYPSHFIQIAGYDLALENGGYTADGKKILEAPRVDYYTVWPFGAKEQQPAINYDTKTLREGFRSALTLYKIINQNEIR